MSFITQYLQNNKLEPISDAVKKRVDQAEQKLHDFVKNAAGPLSFDDCLKLHGADIADLVGRVSKYIADRPALSLASSLSLLRFVYNISVEAYQIVEKMSGCVVTSTMTPKEQHDAKVSFGKQLVYFVWTTVDPLKNKLNWVPFKKTIEKKLVLWLAGMSLEAVVDLLAASTTVKTMSAESNKQDLILGIPR